MKSLSLLTVATGLVGLTTLFLPARAQAMRTGMNFACVNCHEGQDKPEVVATLSADRIEPGQSVTITVTATHPTAVIGGVLVDSKELGAFEIVDPAETHLFEDSPTLATHVEPKPYSDGQVEFTFSWVAPDMVGPMEFEIWANAANDNLDPHDDHAQGITANLGVGCDAAWYYLDADADGYGEESTGIHSCEVVPDRINDGGDCDDQNVDVHSGIVEVCNDIDDNCDGEIDEGFEKSLWIEDLDGDGFGDPSGQTKIGCDPQPGFAKNFDDCNDQAAGVNPDAVEVMNGLDDNCNGLVDEAPTDEGTGVPVGAGGGPSEPTTPAPTTTTNPVGTALPAPTSATTAPAASAGQPPVMAQAPMGGSSSSSGCAVHQPRWNSVSMFSMVLVGLGLLARRRRRS